MRLRGVQSLLVLVGLLSSAVHADVLTFVQTVWSNGARNPKRVCKNDTNGAEKWVQGFGALTQVGMGEQFHVGETLFNDYADNSKFLSSVYKSAEIYFRSSDDRSTIAGAYSNALGMYFNRTDYVPDEDYPNIAGWPRGFVPIAVHVTEPTTDFAVNYASTCVNYTQLISKLKAEQEYLDFLDTNKESLNAIRTLCGEQQLDAFDLWVVAESAAAEAREGLPNVIPDAQREELKRLYNNIEKFRHGLGFTTSGTDYRKELAKLKGGNLLWNIIDHMDLKIKCNGKTTSRCHWMAPLKYYAYSTDISMVRSLLAALDADDLFEQTFTSDYGSIVFELWNTSDGFQIKMKFHNGTAAAFTPATESVKGCNVNPSGYCSLTDFKNRSTAYFPSDINAACVTQTPNSVNAKAKADGSPRVDLTANLAADDTGDLLFVQAVWRHGDRSPVMNFVCKNDPNPESSWSQGFDQLSFRGMQQHFTFGSMIYNRYVTEGKFLSPKYTSAEVEVRSTDYNRTIISAISNLIGMYYNKGALVAGVDYPKAEDIPRWPSGYVPIPIHTIVREDEYMADIPAPKCPRKYKLQDLGYETEEIRKVVDANKDLIDNFTALCGMDMTMNLIHGPVDTWLVEDIFNKSKLFDKQTYAKLKALDNKAEDVRAGQLAYFPFSGDIDLSIELPKIRGGLLLWHLIENFESKIRCINGTASSDECDAMKTRKYYIYSSHDITLLALLSALEVRDRVILAGTPNYSAGLLFELYNTSNGYEIRVLFHRIVNETFFEDITGLISGCPEGTRCPLEMFKARSLPFKVDDILKLCFDMPPEETTTTTATSTVPLSQSTTTSSAQSYSSGISTSLFILLRIVALMGAASLYRQ